MDQQLQERLHVYRQKHLVSQQIVHVVNDILLWLERTSHHPCTEENIGTFASHLMLALGRIEQGETPGSLWDASVHAEAMRQTPLIPWAEHIEHEVQRILGLALPPEEFDFLLLHLAAFQARSNDPLRFQENQ
ncbi:MAG: hypothetical protein PVS3B1_17950 [Ktedonobacteraceae bacterium]